MPKGFTWWSDPGRQGTASLRPRHSKINCMQGLDPQHSNFPEITQVLISWSPLQTGLRVVWFDSGALLLKHCHRLWLLHWEVRGRALFLLHVKLVGSCQTVIPPWESILTYWPVILLVVVWVMTVKGVTRNVLLFVRIGTFPGMKWLRSWTRVHPQGEPLFSVCAFMYDPHQRVSVYVPALFLILVYFGILCSSNWSFSGNQ